MLLTSNISSAPQFGLLQRLLGAAKPVTVQAAIVDAFLEIDAHGTERRQRAAPVVAWVDVLGADRQWVARSLVHGRLLRGIYCGLYSR